MLRGWNFQSLSLLTALVISDDEEEDLHSSEDDYEPSSDDGSRDDEANLQDAANPPGAGCVTPG